MNLIFGLILLNYYGFGAVEIVPREKQDEVLIKGPVEKGIFGGPVIKFTELKNEFACFVGGRGAIVLNHTFAIGGGGYGLVNRIVVHTDYPLGDYYMDFGYGGLILELIFGSRRMIHFGISSLIGGGDICYRTNYFEPWYDDAVFVFEPGAELTLNVTRCFRIDLGGSYRYIYGTDLDGISDKTLSNGACHLTFKFGRF